MKFHPPFKGRPLAMAVASLVFTSTWLPAQDILWEAFNDYRPSDLTDVNATGYDLRITDDGGALKNIATGADLSATVTVVAEGGDPDDFGANSPVNPGSPADLLFGGKVDIGNDGLPGLRASNSIKLMLVFKGLDPTKRYNFRGTVSRGGNYNDRWAVYTIDGADAHVAAHVDGSDNQNIITKDTFPAADLAANQVALNTGDNKAGSLVGWDNIEPGADREFTIIAEQYVGAAPFGNPAAAPYGYGFSAIYLAQVESTGELRIEANPVASQKVPTGDSATFEVVASSPQPLTYQWQRAAPNTRDFVNIAGATGASYTTPALSSSDHGGIYRCLISSAGFDLISGESLVEVDSDVPFVSKVEGSINFNAVYLTFSEPMKLSSLANSDRYKISNGLGIRSVQVRSSQSVRLVTDPQPKNANYTVTVSDLEDLGGNKVDANSEVTFKTYSYANDTVGLEVWENLGGGAVQDLRNYARFPAEPDVDYSLESMDSLLAFPDGPNNTYGGRFRGWLIPEESGEYEFFLRADDAGEFRISEGTQFAAFEDPDSLPDAEAAGNNVFQEPGTDASTSEPVTLTAGKKYAVEVLWKESNGGDRAQLAWRKVGDGTPADALEPIPSRFFCYFGSRITDSDNDGMSDAYEVLNGLNTKVNDAKGDLDKDGLTNIQEHDLGTAANLEDSDSDGLKDGVETGTGIWVSASDTGSNPQIADSDQDTLLDGAEVARGSDPNKVDTDSDTFADNVEVALSTDPANPASKPDVIIGVAIGGWDLPATWSDGQAPRAGKDYVVVNSVTAEVSAVAGAFPGDSLTLIGPNMALRADHTDAASANIVLDNATLKVRASNTLNGSLALTGRVDIDGQGHTSVIGASLTGSPLLNIFGTEGAPGTLEFAGSGAGFHGLITVTNENLFGSAPGSLGDGSITLIAGGVTFGYDYNSPTALIKIQGGDFSMTLNGDVTVADVVGVETDGSLIFSLSTLAGPGPYTADDLNAAFQVDAVFGDGTLTLAGNTGDTDLDGLADAWETTHFGNLTATPGGDPDGDGLINLAEVHGGTDPNKADAPVKPVDPDPDPVDPGDARPLVSAITKDAAAVGLSFPAGVTFDVEYSEDLRTWSVISSGVQGAYQDTDTARVAKGSGYYRGVAK